MYHRDWYDGIGDVAPVKKKGEKIGRCAYSGARGLFATAGAVALCVTACFISGNIFGADAFSSESRAKNEAVPPSPPAENDASFVMSWVFDEQSSDMSNDGEVDGGDGDGDLTDDSESASDGAERIKELAEEYISSHMKNSGERGGE